MIGIPLKEAISLVKSSNRDDHCPWIGSENEEFRNLSTPQDKGKVGVLVYQSFLKALGQEPEIVNAEGDIEYTDPYSGLVKDEVKTAAATMSYRKRDKKFTTKHWVNQIRPMQKSWSGIVLVAVFPNYYQIHRMKREDYFRNRIAGSAGITSGHTGTNELDQVILVDNTSQNSYNEWELIFEG